MSAFARLAILSLNQQTPSPGRSRMTNSQNDEDGSRTPHSSPTGPVVQLQLTPATAMPVRLPKPARPQTIWVRARAAMWL